MFRQRINGAVPAAAAVALVLTFAACGDLSVSRLSANYHFAKANRYFTENQYRKAIAEYDLTLKNNPKMTQAYRFLGESYKQLYKPGVNAADNLDKKNKAIEALNKALELEPNNKDIIYSLGDMYDKTRDYAHAEKLYLRILELEPSNMSNYYVLAEFYKRYAGEKKEAAQKAESMYLRRIEADPENPQGYAYMAAYLEPPTAADPNALLKSYELAAEYRYRIIALQPNSAEAWLGLGINQWSRAYRFQFIPAEQRLATANESLKSLQKAISIDPNYPEPYAYLSVLYRSTLSKLEPEKEARYIAEADKASDKFQDLRKRIAARKKLEEELKKTT
ncbi:MAG TPA: tetratricopeptide repeat protein [Terriglobales bacterium]|nr:tetratricopeptide repeat protein [Terriglobales bacterium]